MATQFAPPAMPPSVAALPFLFARPQSNDMGWNYRSALLAAAAAEGADDTRRNTRGRIAYLLCEYGFQLARRRIDRDGDLQLSRYDIADALGVSLCRVKRTLALLSLSQVIECKGGAMWVLDWPRLCSVACYPSARLGFTQDDEDDLEPAPEVDEQPQFLTKGVDQACFG